MHVCLLPARKCLHRDYVSRCFLSFFLLVDQRIWLMTRFFVPALRLEGWTPEGGEVCSGGGTVLNSGEQGRSRESEEVASKKVKKRKDRAKKRTVELFSLCKRGQLHQQGVEHIIIYLPLFPQAGNDGFGLLCLRVVEKGAHAVVRSDGNRIARE